MVSCECQALLAEEEVEEEEEEYLDESEEEEEETDDPLQAGPVRNYGRYTCNQNSRYTS